MIQNKNKDWKEKTDQILDAAWKEGRDQLFEHEVYKIISLLGMQTPYYEFITDSQQITGELLNKFGSDKVVLKIVSESVIHKKKLGGVRIVYKDTGFVKFSFEKMVKDFKDNNFSVRGILLVDFINYSEEIGNEILLGLRETPSFGPVLSFSKGGADAEHFASRYSPPNLVLPPVGKKWAKDLLSSTEIYKKYTKEKKDNYIGHINSAQVKFSDLAESFSNFFESDSKFFIKEFEINPFIFDREGNFKAIDGYASFGLKKTCSEKPKKDSWKSLETFFYPKSVAVMGVSTSDNNKSGNIIVKNLLGSGKNNIFCVNPRGGEIEIEGNKLKVYKSLASIPEKVDFAIITVPAKAVPLAIDDCAEKKVKAVLLIPGGFSETTGSSDIEEQILKIAKENSFRIMGPNCLGIYHSESNINTFFIPENKFSINKELNQNVAILSQSGALGIVEIHNLRNSVSPRAIVSYGNALDTGPCDLVSYFANDSKIKVIALYIEGFNAGEGRRFFDIVSKIKKPVVVYKAGRTEAGMHATQSHTASMSGEYAVAKAAMKQAGIIVADSMADHTGYIKTFSLFSSLSVSGKRTAVVANAGYEKANAADNIGDLEVAELDDTTRKKLTDIIPPFINAEPLLDLTPMAGDKAYIDSFEVFLASDKVDNVVVSIIPCAGPLTTTNDEIAACEKNIASELVRIYKKYKKPVVVSIGVEPGDDLYSRLARILDSGGIPTFSSAEKAMKYLNAFVRYKLIKEKHIMSEWIKDE